MTTIFARIATAFPLAFLVMSAGSAVAGVPSHPGTDRGTLFESGTPPNPSATHADLDRATLVRTGASLYGEHCASCHGADLSGSVGAPSLLKAGGAATDFYITTGRMPIAVRSNDGDATDASTSEVMADGVQDYHVAPQFNARETAALVAYVDSRAQQTLPIPDVHTDATRLQRGRDVFEIDCEQCHGAAAEGATAGEQWTALPLDRATPTQIGEAIRIGPGVMPRFTQAELSDRDLDAVATYVDYLTTTKQDYGGTTLANLGPAGEGGIGAFFGVGMLFWVIYFTGTKADGRRVNDLD